MEKQSAIVFDLYEKMSAQKIISAYHGEFTQQVINMLLKQAKWDLLQRNTEKITTKRTYGVMVECLENILKHTTLLRHSGQIEANIDGLVILGNQSKDYYITIGNLIKKEEVGILTERMEKINKLDRDELRKHHTEVLKKSEISAKGGAGLGLIEIALKSGSKLNYEFNNYNDTLSFFAMQVIISTNIQA
ncbi:MAG: hypothetical protein COA57_09065 [Flavobacteriales bacterium]|nr:MAG: hypothetical protein COA57_09065 [Flavobacteriales bacterium]